MATLEANNTMRAWLYTRVHNGIENSLTLNEAAPRPPWPPTTTTKHGSSNQVLVKVHFASLNPVDYKIADLGLLARAMVSVPASPGLDFSGTVASLPSNPSAALANEGFQVGDRVFGRLDPTRFGALGEYVVADYEGLAKIPEKGASSSSSSLEHASCLGTAAATALQCIGPNVRAGAGDRVFINGGSGGTGTFGIQVAKALGCWVAASCSTANVELCRSLGADVVVDYKTQDVSAVLRELAAAKDDGGGDGKKFALVVDNVGSSPRDLYKAANDYLDPEGRFVQVGGTFSLADLRATLSRALLPGFLGGGRRSYSYLLMKNIHADLVRLAGWMAEGKVKAIVDGDGDEDGRVFNDAGEAFRKLKTGRARGKVVVRVAKET